MASFTNFIANLLAGNAKAQAPKAPPKPVAPSRSSSRPIVPTSRPAAQAQVNLARTGNIQGIPSSSSSSGGSSGGGGSSVPSDLYEQAPDAPDYSLYENLYGESLAALDQVLSARQAGTEADIATFGQQAASQKKTTEDQLAEVKGQLNTNQIREKQKTQESQDSIRQSYSEQLQGIQSLYGGSTGTGGFASEILGREVLKQMGSNERNLQNTLADIDNTRISTINEANRRLFDIESKSQELVRKAKAQLDLDRAEIASKKGELLAAKQQRYLAALENYRDIVSTINARNTQFRQQLFRDQQDFEQQLQTRKLQINKKFSTDLNKNLKGVVNRTRVDGTSQQTTAGGQILPSTDEDNEIEDLANLDY